MQSRRQMTKHGHLAERDNPNAKLRTTEVANLVQSVKKIQKRTDCGNIRLARSVGRQRDYLIKG